MLELVVFLLDGAILATCVGSNVVRGGRTFAMRATYAFRHLTLWSMAVQTAAFSPWGRDTVFEDATVGLSTFVGLFFWTFVIADPALLMNRAVRSRRRAVRSSLFWPTSVRTLVAFLFLHHAHTFTFIVPFLARARFAHVAPARAAVAALAIFWPYATWNFVCWRIRGEPTYPVQRRMQPFAGYLLGAVGVALAAAGGALAMRS